MRRLLLALSLLSTPALGRTTEDEQFWLNVTVFGALSKDIVYFVEAQPRLGNGATHFQQILMRGGVGVQLTPSLTLWQGYGHVALPVDRGSDRNEERSFQQLWWTIRPGFWIRTRLEERWLSNGGDMGLRLRSMIRYGYKLGSSKRSVAALVSAEPFIALNSADWGQRAGFDQLRSFAGIEIPTVGRSTIELGYLNQLINDPGGRRRMNHVAAINVFFRI